MRGLRSFLYALARLIGDLNAVSRGPTAIAKRVARKAAYRTAAKGITRILK